MASPTTTTSDVVSFGPFSLIASERSLTRDGAAVELSGRALDILIVLIAHSNEVVSKKDLLAQVWPDTTVEETSLRFHVANLRKTLGDGQHGARYITTSAGRGYCFVASISRAAPAQPSRADDPTPDPILRLPTRLSRMIGRHDNVREISKALAAQRFVTIVGPGGIGKTTVAVAICHALVDEFGGAIRFVDLGPLNDPSLVPIAVASTLGLMVSSHDPLPSLIAFLRGKRMLLVLDSCEHVIHAATTLAERVLSEAPQVQILATSRETLRAEGEHVHRLLPLDSPPDAASLTAAQALTFPAVQLFVERVAARVNDFALNDRDAGAVAEICRRLDGLALAIELAAGRVDAYGIQGIADLLDKRLGLRWQGRRTAVARHQTLSAMFDWSHNLLSEFERVIFRRLSIFVGTFTLEAARSVAADGAAEDAQIAEAVAGLVTKSVISTHMVRGSMRYRVLDTTRAYAFDKLIESGETDAIARRHAIHYRDVVEHLGAAPPSETERGAAYGEHLANVRVALEWAFAERRDLDVGTSLAAAACPLFIEMSLLIECRLWAERAIAALDEATRGSRRDMELQAALGVSLMFTKGNTEEVRLALMRGLELATRLNCPFDQVRLLGGLHVFHERIGDFRDSLTSAQRCEAVARELGDPAAISVARSMLGLSHHILGDQANAHVHLGAALASPLSSQQVNLAHFGMMHFGFHYRNRARIALARNLWLRGYADQAATVARQTVEEAAALDHAVTLCVALIWASSIHLWTGNWPSAETNIERLIAHSERHSLAPYNAAGHGQMGELMVRRGTAQAGIEKLRAALEVLRGARYNRLAGALACALVEGLAQVGEIEEASHMIEDVIAVVGHNGDAFNMAELLRIKGTILAAVPHSDPTEAEGCFLHSIALAGRQSARSWELRAATSLAALRSKQGRNDEARDVLSGIYGQFSEGFESRDLKAARQLLDRLG